MTLSFTGRKRIRRGFGRIHEVAPMPNLIEVQRQSYEQFLQRDVAAEDRPDSGLQAVFKSVFPIRDFSDHAELEFVKYDFEEPKYDVEECQQRGATYAALLKVTLRLVVWDVDEETGSRSIRDIKEQDVYMGDMPLMTDRGTFNYQRHLAGDRVPDAPQPRRVFRSRQGQDPHFWQVSFRRPGHSLSRLLARF